MRTLVSVSKAAELSHYTTVHIRQLIRKRLVTGEKQGGIWLVELDSLMAYKKAMDEAGPSKFDPTKNQ
ncbi:MAG: DNA-binding protein [Chloroflexota bacterium]|nr:DNA-binding protein [Chloroflexota bacterium]